MSLVRYLTHPQVRIDPATPIPEWGLNEEGAARVAALAASGALEGTRRVVSSGEVKALETARPLAEALGCEVEIRDAMHENDRSSTGYLPPDEFEHAADQFFAHPDQSFRGWETAQGALARILAELDAVLATETEGDVLIVGHGGVGTLMMCELAMVPISRRRDQPAGGGNWFEFRAEVRAPFAPWQPMEALWEED